MLSRRSPKNPIEIEACAVSLTGPGVLDSCFNKTLMVAICDGSPPQMMAKQAKAANAPR
jgi:hypothetical protein